MEELKGLEVVGEDIARGEPTTLRVDEQNVSRFLFASTYTQHHVVVAIALI
jgi:hypothetical protein